MHPVDLVKKYIAVSSSLENALYQSWGNAYSVKKGKLLLQDGEICNHLYYIVSGGIEIFYYLGEKRITKWFGFENEFRTSAYSFISRKPTAEYIEAIEDCVLMKIAHHTFEQNYIDFPELERFGRLMSQQLYLLKEEREHSILSKTAKERYDALLDSHPELVNRVSLGKIASYLGFSQETLSRIRSTSTVICCLFAPFLKWFC